MSFLRFGAEICTLTSDPQDGKQLATLSLSKASFRDLSRALGEIEAKEGSELRTEFPGGWTIFWKIRDGESRFFLARPETDQWVATLALSRTHLDAIRVQMDAGAEGALSSHEAISRMSNIEVILAVQGSAGVSL